MDDYANLKNPWSFDNIDEYLFYCCPQCDHRYKSKPSFVLHAFESHPESKERIKDVGIELHQEPLAGYVIKEEVRNSDIDDCDEAYVVNDNEDSSEDDVASDTIDNGTTKDKQKTPVRISIIKRTEKETPKGTPPDHLFTIHVLTILFQLQPKKCLLILSSATDAAKSSKRRAL